jgi:hypothetical protein
MSGPQGPQQQPGNENQQWDENVQAAGEAGSFAGSESLTLEQGASQQQNDAQGGGADSVNYGPQSPVRWHPTR